MQIELKAYESKVNLTLFNDIVAFVLDTAEATRAQRAALFQRCPFLYHQSSQFQEKHQFLYLGELLERYEERFGMSIQDLRAIALALGFVKDFTIREMFVGSQKEDFLKKVQRGADDDIYLNGALYLLYEGQSGMAEREQKLTNVNYDSTEDLLSVIGLFQDHERAFLRFKPQLLRLVGRERTMPVMGNMTAWNWFITWLAPNLKKNRGKDMALFRALCALSTAYVKPDGKSHGILLEHGYKPLEIAYMNMLVVLSRTAPNVLRTDSITSEKIAIDLFHQVLVCEEPFAPEVYEQLSQVYRIYANFNIRCGGCSRLLQTLEDGTTIQNVETFIWFSRQADIRHQVFWSFDVKDSKWDPLAKALKPEQYRPLVDFCMREDMSKEEIQQRLDRYQELVGKNYTDIYWENSNATHFGLLVNRGILDLWSLFRNSLDGTGAVIKSAMLSNIKWYVGKISTKQAYQFCEKFFTVYGAAGLEKYFGRSHGDFFEALTTRSSYSSGPFQLNLQRDFLDEDGHRQLLSWLEEYIFVYKPEEYLLLITAILQDDFVSGLFTPEERRKLFDLTVKMPDIPLITLNTLKQRYLSDSELQAEQEAREAALRIAEEQRRQELVQSIQEKYKELLDGTFSSVIKFLDQYTYYQEQTDIACRTVQENLGGLLEMKSYELDRQEAVRFLHVCNRLVKEKAMSFTEVQEYILKIKECVEHGT